MSENLIQDEKEHRKKSHRPHMEGKFESNTRGFGFVVVDGLESDLYIPKGKTLNAFYGDVVEVKLLSDLSTKQKHRTEAEVIRILSHSVKTVVGTFEKEGSHGYVVPDNRHIPYDLHVDRKDEMGAVPGHKVVLEITDYGSAKRNASGKIVEILGHMDDPGVDILSIIRANDLPTEFPEEVKEQVETRIPSKIKASDYVGLMAKRKGSTFTDLRKTLMVTIDGLDTKDIDDAVSLRRTENGYELGVHIADVSYYVTEDSPLDREALNRGTSVYLVDRVIPMLPHELSNGICSLNEGEDRLALSVIMDLDRHGKLVDHRIEETVIKVDARLSYTGVYALLSEDDDSEIRDHLKKQGIKRGIDKKTDEIAEMLRDMQELSVILSKDRKERGSIDFETSEPKITLDPSGRPLKIEKRVSNEADTIIENFMILANETVAQHFYWLDTPFVYRTHGKPDPIKIRELVKFLQTVGISVKTSKDNSEIHPREVAGILRKAKGTPGEATIQRMALRSMQRAEYSTECNGHFGLALQYYCHFTSPIRRYPDLCIHRIIREAIKNGGLTEERTAYLNAILPDVAGKSSRMERRATDAERDADKQKMCEYMEEHIGESFDGTISGLTSFGMYVELESSVEGLVPMAMLYDDYYVFDEKSYILVGERTHRQYHLGDPVRVKVAAVDTTLRTIDFSLEMEKNGKAKRSAKTRRKQ